MLKYTVTHTQLDLIAITDHDEIDGALRAVELGPVYGLEVIPGCEISTRQGHLLALFIQCRVPRSLPLEETVLRVRELGGVCNAPHPGARGANSLSEESLRQALANPLVQNTLLGIETFNASLFHQRSNVTAWGLARSLHLSQVGDSDSHVLKTIGLGATQFPGHTAQDLRAALALGTTTRLVNYRQPGTLGLIRTWLPMFLLRRAGWVGASAGPHAPIRLKRTTQ